MGKALHLCSESSTQGPDAPVTTWVRRGWKPLRHFARGAPASVAARTQRIALGAERRLPGGVVNEEVWQEQHQFRQGTAPEESSRDLGASPWLPQLPTGLAQPNSDQRFGRASTTAAPSSSMNSMQQPPCRPDPRPLRVPKRFTQHRQRQLRTAIRERGGRETARSAEASATSKEPSHLLERCVASRAGPAGPTA